jgi:WD40 repeat protein
MMALSQDGKVLVTDAKEKTELRTWTIAKDKPETPFAPGLNPITLSYMPGGLVAVASRKMVGVGKPPEFNLLAYEPLKKQLSHSVRIDAGEENAARCLACSSDGRSVSVGCTSKQFHSYDVIQQRVIFNITGYTGAVTALAYGADGKTVVTGSEDKIVVLWEMVAPKPKQGPVFLGHTNSVTCVAISPDGKYAASGATGNAGDKLPVKVWDIANNKEFASVEAHEGTFLGLYFSADSKVLITVGDKTIKFWDVDALPALKQLK